MYYVLRNNVLYNVSSQNQTHKFKNEKLFERSTLNIDLSYLVITFQFTNITKLMKKQKTPNLHAFFSPTIFFQFFAQKIGNFLNFLVF
jgi:hypothetical protein